MTDVLCRVCGEAGRDGGGGGVNVCVCECVCVAFMCMDACHSVVRSLGTVLPV